MSVMSRCHCHRLSQFVRRPVVYLSHTVSHRQSETNRWKHEERLRKPNEKKMTESETLNLKDRSGQRVVNF